MTGLLRYRVKKEEKKRENKRKREEN